MNKPRSVQGIVLFTITQATNVIWRKPRHHLVLVTKNVSLTRNVRLAVTMKRGQVAETTGESSLSFIETIVS
jgi:hypothetical protein